MNRTDRLYAVVEALRAAAPCPLSARRLAARLEVSLRTVERDICALNADRTLSPSPTSISVTGARPPRWRHVMTSAQGSIGWFEIASSQPDGAQEFYSELFGWRFEAGKSAGFDYRDIVTGAPGALRGGLMAAAEGLPPHAIFVVQVDDVTASAAAAVAAGGVLQVGPITTETGLVCAYLRDPEGNNFAVMTPPGGTRLAEAVPPAAGSIGWFEVGTTDPDAAQEFYGGLFGWSAERVPDPGMDYRIVTTGPGHPLQGGITATEGRRPSYAILSVIVADVDETCRRAEELGGKVLAGPSYPEAGPPNAYLLDRDGNEFGIFTPPGG